MDKVPTDLPPSVDADEYSEEYFLTTCDGREEYLAHGGTVLPRRLRALACFLDLRPGLRLLDVGCGRGEFVVHCALRGISAVGLDYSPAGLNLARQAVDRAGNLGREGWKHPTLALGSAERLPFRPEAFDRAIMSDLIEHLYRDQLQAALAEVCRVLAPGGQLLIHTMPNLWYYRYGYPLFRLVRRLQGGSLPADPRERFRFSHTHVNEQTPWSLSRLMASSPFTRWKVWLYDYRSYGEYGPLTRCVMCLLTGLPLLKRVFCDDIFALAQK
jgi:cyclopropane fatty-acyl-phospholipid synthase-like methyltransferase